MIEYKKKNAATIIFAQRFALWGNVRDKIIITTGIVIVIAAIIHNDCDDITPSRRFPKTKKHGPLPLTDHLVDLINLLWRILCIQ